MQRVGFLRLTAERSSVLDGEETGLSDAQILLHSLTWLWQHPLCPVFALCVLDRQGQRHLTYCNHISTMATSPLSFQTSLASQRTPHWKRELVFQLKDLKEIQIKTYRFLIIYNYEIKLKFPDHMMAFLH